MISEILNAAAKKKRILILTHNNPDPDAMGAAVGLKHLFHVLLKKKVTIAFMGAVGRLENREFIKQCKIDLQSSLQIKFRLFDYIVVVDTQPQAGNVYFPEGFYANAVIDHHITKKALAKRKDMIIDIRPQYGSASTIIAEYHKQLNVVPDVHTATALCYGIMTDAVGQGRDSAKIDQDMLGFIYPHISLSKIAKIQNPELPRYHYKTLRRAIENAIIIQDLLFCDLNDVRNPDLVAECADYLLRMRDIKCVFVIGRQDDIAIFSLRYKSKRKSVGRIAIRIVKGIGYGGGHTKSAGGQIPLKTKTYDEIIVILKERLKKSLGIKNHEEKLI